MRAEEPLGQEVLHEHLVDGSARMVRVQGVRQRVEEAVEGGLELRVVALGLLDLLGEAGGQMRDAVLELGDGLLEALDVGLGVGEESVEQVGELRGLDAGSSADVRRPFW